MRRTFRRHWPGTLLVLLISGCSQDPLGPAPHDHGDIVPQAVERQLQPAANITVLDLGTLGGPTSFAYGINDAGQVV